MHMILFNNIACLLSITTMPRGKVWSKAESVAMVEAFVHISEDEIIGVNQRKDTLFDRVVNEARLRYSGDWSRGALACRSRWQIVSREVSKFIAADLLVNSIERSGWNEDDYYKATLQAYHGVRGNKGNATDIHEDDIAVSDSELDAPVPEFEFKEEWLILREHEKWRINLSKQETKRKAEESKRLKNVDGLSSGTSEIGLYEETDDSTPSPTSRPIGIKKAKTVVAVKNNQEALLEEIRGQHARSEMARLETKAENKTERDKFVSDLMQHMDNAAEKSFQNFQTVVNGSTQEITKAIKVKMIMDTDWTGMGKSIQARVRRTVRKYLEDTLESEGDSSEDEGSNSNSNRKSDNSKSG
jgi:hypothetical protein